jgi:acyl-coenzyme A synthetase/AMP-(fatty) acid ligase
VPIGVPGEICISGICLAQGYFRDKVKTADKFIVNPFVTSGLDYETMYKTGDVGRWLSDGTIEYIGRVDEQVKIRGYRIEPGEIEESMLRYKGISAAAVTVQEMGNGEKELAGYFVSESEISSSDLRHYLRTALPVYMIPAWLIWLNALVWGRNAKT